VAAPLASALQGVSHAAHKATLHCAIDPGGRRRSAAQPH